MKIEYRPLSTWPSGPRTPAAERVRSPFRASWDATIELLERELWTLGVGEHDVVVLEAGYTAGDIRRDGLPRKDARQPTDPGIVVSFESTHGPLRYACDRYRTNADNLRAIALSLEALRAVDRWGVLKRGEQYVGNLALPAVTPTRVDAEATIRRLGAGPVITGLSPDEALKVLYRRAVRRLHPDVPLVAGETSDDRVREWGELVAAKTTLGL